MLQKSMIGLSKRALAKKKGIIDGFSLPLAE